MGELYASLWRGESSVMDNPKTDRTLKTPNRSWIQPFEAGGGPRYKQIARQIIKAIDDGILRPGDRLPPQRDLAQTMGVDLTTVTRAYSEVRFAGLLDAHGAGGTFIASTSASEARTIDLGMNIPPLLGSSLFARLMDVGMEHVLDKSRSGDLMSYHVGAGSRSDRDAAVAWLDPVLGQVRADRVVVCPGTQSALAALLIAKTRSGDTIASDSLTYPGFLAAARMLQRAVVAVPSDQEGMLPDELDRICTSRPPALIYLVPTIHNPTAITMSAQRRKDIYAVASRHGIGIVEDDPYWLLAGDAPLPLAALGASGGAPVFYVSTLSKCLAPGLRTSYLVVPESEPLEPILDVLRSITLMSPQTMVTMATHWIRTGLAVEMLQKIRQELNQRQKLAERILPGIIQAHPFGLHLWLGLPPKLDEHHLIQAAYEQSLGVANSQAFSADGSPANAIRISLGGATDQATLKAGLVKLAKLLAADRRHRMPAIV